MANWLSLSRYVSLRGNAGVSVAPTPTPSPTPTPTTTFSTGAELSALMAAATGGEIFGGTAGASIGSWSLSSKTYASDVTITAVDTSNPPVFTKITLTTCSKVKLDHLLLSDPTYVGEGADGAPLDMNGCSYITYQYCEIKGKTSDATATRGYGVFAKTCNHMTSQRNYIHHWAAGEYLQDSSYYTVQYNRYEHFRYNGPIKLARISDVVIDTCLFYGNHSPAGSGEHWDLVQHTRGGAGEQPQRITVSNCFGYDGDFGGVGGDGITFQNDYALYPTDRGSAITIASNQLWKFGYDSIHIMDCDTISVTNNACHMLPDYQDPPDNAYTRVQLERCSGTATGNSSSYGGPEAYEYRNNEVPPGVTTGSNTVLPASETHAAAAAAMAAWRAAKGV